MEKDLKAELEKRGLSLDQIQYYLIKEKLENYNDQIDTDILVRFSEKGGDASIFYKFPKGDFDEKRYSYIKGLAQVDYKIKNNLSEDYTNMYIYNYNAGMLFDFKFYHDEEFLESLNTNEMKK